MNYPDDKLYLRVGVLIDTLIGISTRKDGGTLIGRDFDLYQYLRRIKLEVSPNNDIDRIKRTEDFLLSNTFINSDVISNHKDTFTEIIRDYKLKLLL